MVRLPRISGVHAVRVLERLGFRKVRQRGSHVILKKAGPDKDVGCVVPLHSELAAGTLRGLLRQAGVTPEEFAEKS